MIQKKKKIFEVQITRGMFGMHRGKETLEARRQVPVAAVPAVLAEKAVHTVGSLQRRWVHILIYLMDKGLLFTYILKAATDQYSKNK